MSAVSPDAVSFPTGGPARLRRLWRPLQESCRLHDHAVDAVAALHSLFFDEGLLERMRMRFRAEPLKGYDLAAGER